MESDDEDDSNMNLVIELEEATEMVDEVRLPVEDINTDQASCDRLVKLPSPKVSVSRTGATSACIDQMILLKNMDCKRLKENPADDNVFVAHQCKHCNTLLSFPWKDDRKQCLGLLIN